MKRWLWIRFVILVVAAGILTSAYGDVLREQLLRPILYMLWLWWLRLQSLPLELIWFVFIALAALGAYVAVMNLVFWARASSVSQEIEARESPVRALERKIMLACEGELGRWNLHRELADVAVNWIALHHGLSENEARRRFNSRETLSELREVLDLEFPASEKRRLCGWLNLFRATQKRRQLQELSQLMQNLEDLARGSYATTDRSR